MSLIFDHVSDLHVDNGMMGGPHAFVETLDVGRWKTSQARYLMVAGDTADTGADAATALNLAGRHYDRVFAIAGNHEREPPAPLNDNVWLLDRETPALGLDDHTLVIGASLFQHGDVQRIVDLTARAMAGSAYERLIIVAHAVPSRDILWRGLGIDSKVVELVGFLPLATKPAAIVFGHSHVPHDQVVRGYRCVSNPRGYRGERRDGSTFRGFESLTL